MTGFPRLREGPRQTVAVAVGLGAFALVYFALGLILAVSVVVAAVGYGATLWTVRSASVFEQQALVEGSRVTRADLRSALAEVAAAQTILGEAAARAEAGSPAMSRRITALSGQLDRLAVMLEDDPTLVSTLRQLVNGLLGRVANAIHHAAKTDALTRKDVDTALSSVEERIAQIIDRRADARADAAEADLEILAAQLDRQL